MVRAGPDAAAATGGINEPADQCTGNAPIWLHRIPMLVTVSSVNSYFPATNTGAAGVMCSKKRINGARNLPGRAGLTSAGPPVDFGPDMACVSVTVPPDACEAAFVTGYKHDIFTAVGTFGGKVALALMWY